MHRYFATTTCIHTADPVYRDSHETVCTGILEKDKSKHILFSDQIDGNTQYSTSSSCSSRYNICWSSKLCAALLITGVSAFMLLMTSLWHLIVFRYVLYHKLFIKIWIVAWGTRIVTPLLRCVWLKVILWYIVWIYLNQLIYCWLIS